jgi:hypothetical protein
VPAFLAANSAARFAVARTQKIRFWFLARVGRFVRLVEDVWMCVDYVSHRISEASHGFRCFCKCVFHLSSPVTLSLIDTMVAARCRWLFVVAKRPPESGVHIFNDVSASVVL